MKSRTSFLNRTVASVFFITLLNACGGGDSDQLPKAISFESLDGVANEFSSVFCGSVRSFVGVDGFMRTHPCGSETLSMYALIRSNAELEPFKAELVVTARVMNTPIALTSLRPIADPDYFARHDLLLIDTYFQRGKHLSIHSVKETASRVEICFALINKFDGGGESEPLDISRWFAIPKTNKPVVVLPLAYWDGYSPAPVGFPTDGCLGASK